MKLNIAATLLFTILLTMGISTRSGAQEWRWHRYGHCAGAHCADTASCHGYGHGCWGGYAPRRFYRHACWGAKCCPEMAEWFKEDSMRCAKHHQEMESHWKNYWKDSEDHSKCSHSCGDHCWGRGWYGRRWWNNDYYYRGGGY